MRMSTSTISRRPQEPSSNSSTGSEGSHSIPYFWRNTTGPASCPARSRRPSPRSKPESPSCSRAGTSVHAPIVPQEVESTSSTTYKGDPQLPLLHRRRYRDKSERDDRSRDDDDARQALP